MNENYITTVSKMCAEEEDFGKEKRVPSHASEGLPSPRRRIADEKARRYVRLAPGWGPRRFFSALLLGASPLTCRCWRASQCVQRAPVALAPFLVLHPPALHTCPLLPASSQQCFSLTVCGFGSTPLAMTPSSFICIVHRLYRTRFAEAC